MPFNSVLGSIEPGGIVGEAGLTDAMPLLMVIWIIYSVGAPEMLPTA